MHANSSGDSLSHSTFNTTICAGYVGSCRWQRFMLTSLLCCRRPQGLVGTMRMML